jgi:hypothetical protein
MTTQPRPAVLLLAASLFLGVTSDALLRSFPPGLNASLVLIFFIGSLALLALRLDHPLVGGWKIVAAASVLCAVSLSLRDSPALFMFNFAGAAGGCALIAARTSSRRLRESTVFELGHGMLVHVVHSIAGAGFLIAREVRTGSPGEGTRRSVIHSLLRGLVVALPLLLLFGSLFSAADASFEGVIGRLFDFDLSSLFTHILVTVSVTWAAAGFLRGSLLAEEVPVPTTLREAFFSLGITEVAVALGLIDGLFLLFVVLQIPYLFGGAATVAATASVTFAGYARRGFFELTAVACFTIVTLLLADWILRKDSPRSVVLFRSLAGVNLLLLGVVMASAWQRLLLYQEAYGLTEARLYAAAALTGMGLVAVWFALSVLAGRRNRFAFGSILAAYAVILALDFMNPDALIARIDLARGSEGKPFDAEYIAHLSADATPGIIAGIDRIASHDRALLSRAFVRRNDSGLTQDWRSWNLSRNAASAAIRDHIDTLITASRPISLSQ